MTQIGDAHLPYPPGTRWRWSSKRGNERDGELVYYWEPNLSPISDDYDPHETDARDLWRIWVNRVVESAAFDREGGPGWMRVHWFVYRDEPLVDLEWAPFASRGPDWPRSEAEDFLSFFTWPSGVDVRERLNWLRVPVMDKRWTSGIADKGGFIQEALGWKPAPLQPLMHLPSLARAAGVYYPDDA